VGAWRRPLYLTGALRRPTLDLPEVERELGEGRDLRGVVPNPQPSRCSHTERRPADRAAFASVYARFPT